MSILFEQRSEFDDRDKVLQVTLGLVSCAQQVQALRPRFEAETGGRHDEAPDAFLFFLLGIASFSSTVLAHAGRAAEAGGEARRTDDDAALDPRLARSLLAV